MTRKQRRRRTQRRRNHERGRARVVAGAGLGIGAAFGAGASAEAATFTVSSLSDAGGGSLRQAVIDANNAVGPDEIVFQSGLSGTITVATGQIDITDALQVHGPGPGALTVSGNQASGIFYLDVAGSAPVTISGMTLTGGSVPGDGGAIYNYDAILTVSDAVISGNRASSDGGGISSQYGGVTLVDSTVSGNTAGDLGGGVYTYNLPNSEPVLIERSTIAGNVAQGANPAGGGVYLFEDQIATIRSSTVSGNSATTGSGGGIGAYNADPAIVNSIVADNSATSAPDLYNSPSNSFSTAGFSLIESTTGAIVNSTGPNIVGQDAKLGPLQDNGGSTPTQALLAGSPALDKGQATGVDQRGLARPFDLNGVPLAAGGNSADIGAYERVLCGKVAVNRIGGPGKDKIRGTSGADGILGFGGKDTLSGLGGKDGLCGGPGKDKLRGGGGADVLLGQGGKDLLVGGKGKDKLKGGPGKDKQRQ